MSKIEVTLGDGNTFYGDFLIAKSIENSFNKAHEADAPSELKELLKELASTIGKMSENLSEEEGKRVASSVGQKSSDN
jgi:hypothetical protein